MVELSDEAKAEIEAAVKIVASDKNASDLRKIRDHLMPPTPETTPPREGEPTPPPTKDPAKDGPPEPPKKRGLWNVGYEE